jgi:hypothetical protein
MDHVTRCVSPAAFDLPKYRVSSAWREHAPFAFWLVETHRPRVLVELGTHAGYSYLAFCQQVRRMNLSARCYAVDTWQGDEHAGFYGEDVLARLRRHHDSRYSEFSRLIRSTFDAAVGQFDDGSIDLLHIDGRHFYDDVRHDFETWRPKLSPRAIVLFHDTDVRERDFGVYRLWEQISAHAPHFEFKHGHGLGVLGCGPEASDFPLFLAAGDEEATRRIRQFYSRLGSKFARVKGNPLKRMRQQVDRLYGKAVAEGMIPKTLWSRSI